MKKLSIDPVLLSSNLSYGRVQAGAVLPDRALEIAGWFSGPGVTLRRQIAPIKMTIPCPYVPQPSLVLHMVHSANQKRNVNQLRPGWEFRTVNQDARSWWDGIDAGPATQPHRICPALAAAAFARKRILPVLNALAPQGAQGFAFRAEFSIAFPVAAKVCR